VLSEAENSNFRKMGRAHHGMLVLRRERKGNEATATKDAEMMWRINDAHPGEVVGEGK
jgi:hypothetical protein